MSPVCVLGKQIPHPNRLYTDPSESHHTGGRGPDSLGTVDAITDKVEDMGHAGQSRFGKKEQAPFVDSGVSCNYPCLRLVSDDHPSTASLQHPG